jgi:hypothetical protein
MGGCYDQRDSSVARLIRGPAQNNKEKVDRASPVTYVGKDAAPFLIMHGDQDAVVPLMQSVKLAQALKQAGVEVKLHVYMGSGHGGRAFTSPASWRMVESPGVASHGTLQSRRRPAEAPGDGGWRAQPVLPQGSKGDRIDAAGCGAFSYDDRLLAAAHVEAQRPDTTYDVA